jgi:hypothetical protein
VLTLRVRFTYLMKVNRLTTEVTIQRFRFDQLRGLSGSSGPFQVTMKSSDLSSESILAWLSSNFKERELLSRSLVLVPTGASSPCTISWGQGVFNEGPCSLPLVSSEDVGEGTLEDFFGSFMAIEEQKKCCFSSRANL